MGLSVVRVFETNGGLIWWRLWPIWFVILGGGSAMLQAPLFDGRSKVRRSWSCSMGALQMPGYRRGLVHNSPIKPGLPCCFPNSNGSTMPICLLTSCQHTKRNNGEAFSIRQMVEHL